jgi:hypothetical protein
LQAKKKSSKRMTQETLGYFLGLDNKPRYTELNKSRKKDTSASELLGYIRPLIIEFVEYRKCSEEALFRHLANCGIEDRKNIEYILENLLRFELIKETKIGKRRFFERIRRPSSLLC